VIAQLVERMLGKHEVPGSFPGHSSNGEMKWKLEKFSKRRKLRKLE
jgi:hypothetical protein